MLRAGPGHVFVVLAVEGALGASGRELLAGDLGALAAWGVASGATAGTGESTAGFAGSPPLRKRPLATRYFGARFGLLMTPELT